MAGNGCKVDANSELRWGNPDAWRVKGPKQLWARPFATTPNMGGGSPNEVDTESGLIHSRLQRAPKENSTIMDKSIPNYFQPLIPVKQAEYSNPENWVQDKWARGGDPTRLIQDKTCGFFYIMRVLFFATRMPDLCGAFLHDIDLAIELQKRGHQVAFMTTEKPKEGYNGGVYRGFRFTHYTAGTEILESSQVWICPHAPALPIVRKINSRGLDRPIVATCHFDGRYRSITDNITGQWNELLFFINRKMESNFRANINPWPRSIVRTDVIRPIMHEDKIRMDPYPSGDMITLVNANVNKGVHQFIELAKRMPERRFLGVVPYYGELWLPPAPSNIEWIRFDDDVRNILGRTRILLLPSKYESFGRIAVEAMYNKIPVIYSKPDPVAAAPGTTEGVEEWDCSRRYCL
jgi:hypothetical protein